MTTFRDINSGIALITLYFVALWPCHKRGVSRMLVESVYQEQDCVCIYNQAMSKPSGFTLMLPCLWQSKLTILVVQRILRSEELALFAIFWRGKPLFSWCAPSFLVVWTTATLYSLTSLLIKCSAFKKIKIMQPKSFFAKANMRMLHHFSKNFTGSQWKIGYFSR